MGQFGLVGNDSIISFIALGCLVFLFLPDGPQLIITPYTETGPETGKPPKSCASGPIQHRLGGQRHLAPPLQRAGVHFAVRPVAATVGLGFVDVPNGDDFALGAVMRHRVDILLLVPGFDHGVHRFGVIRRVKAIGRWPATGGDGLPLSLTVPLLQVREIPLGNIKMDSGLWFHRRRYFVVQLAFKSAHHREDRKPVVALQLHGELGKVFGQGGHGAVVPEGAVTGRLDVFLRILQVGIAERGAGPGRVEDFFRGAAGFRGVVIHVGRLDDVLPLHHILEEQVEDLQLVLRLAAGDACEFAFDVLGDFLPLRQLFPTQIIV
ncbi:hypothetical protein E2320_000834 [Naja naja]|nr:hypothetical protein E2320_000834 [Naja naja]